MKKLTRREARTPQTQAFVKMAPGPRGPDPDEPESFMKEIYLGRKSSVTVEAWADDPDDWELHIATKNTHGLSTVGIQKAATDIAAALTALAQHAAKYKS